MGYVILSEKKEHTTIQKRQMVSGMRWPLPLLLYKKYIFAENDVNYIFFHKEFLVTCSQLYNPLCRSVCPFLCRP